VTEDQFRKLALALPSAEEGFNMRSVVFKVNGKVLARLLGDGQVMLTGFHADEIDMLAEAEPQAFSATPHFRDAGSLAVDLAAIQPDAMRGFLERRYRQIAKKAAVKAWEAGGAD
jgi:hypothetical protein